MRRVNEARAAGALRGRAGAEGPADRLRDGHGRADDLRPARSATVFVSVLGAERKRSARRWPGLEAAHGVLQARIARELRLKRTPQLAFEYDPAVERGVRMTQADR